MLDPKGTVEKDSNLIRPYISIYDTTLRDGAQVSMEAYTISFRKVQRYLYCDVTMEVTFKLNKPPIKLMCIICGAICFQMVGISFTLAGKLKIVDAFVELGQLLGLQIFWWEKSLDFFFIVIKMRMFFLL